MLVLCLTLCEHLLNERVSTVSKALEQGRSLALPLIRCVTLGNSFNLFGSQFSLQENEELGLHFRATFTLQPASSCPLPHKGSSSRCKGPAK